MSDDITGDLDLLGDWLDAKGYTEEAGLCTRAMDFIHKQGEENEKLRAALRPFADLSSHWEGDKMPLEPKTITIDPLPVLYAVKELR